MNLYRETKLKKQKETHSEIERKRRERMKRETEFLCTQLLDKAVKKDKLSIYKAGAEQLLNYTETLGRREFVLSDNEYSAIILNNINGIALHIQCCNGEILWCNDKIRTVLGLSEEIVINSSLYNISEPSYETENIIQSNLQLDDAEKNYLKSNESIPRSFIIGMKTTDKISKHNCVKSYDGEFYRFIELCGDISNQPDSFFKDEEMPFIFKCIGRPLDLASPCNKSQNKSFTVKILPVSFQVIEIIGNTYDVLGIKPSDFIDLNMVEFVSPKDRLVYNECVKECLCKDNSSVFINLQSRSQGSVPFDCQLNCIKVDSKLLFIIGKFSLIHSQLSESQENIDYVSYKTDELVLDQNDLDTNDKMNDSSEKVLFDLPDCCESIQTKSVEPINDSSYSKSENFDQLPNNDSFKSLLGDCRELFHNELIQDLVSEDINDIKCDDLI